MLPGATGTLLEEMFVLRLGVAECKDLLAAASAKSLGLPPPVCVHFLISAIRHLMKGKGGREGGRIILPWRQGQIEDQEEGKERHSADFGLPS